MTARARLALLALPVVFLGVLFAWPVVAIVATGFDAGAVAGTVLDRTTVELLGRTARMALLSTVATFAVALPGAWVLARVELPGKALLRVAMTVPFVLPTVVVATAVLAVAGPRGVLGDVVRLDDSLAGIVVAHAFFDYAVVARVVGGQWARLDRRAEEAARSLGASRWRVLRTISLPLLRPALASAAVLVFLFSATAYGTVVLLGGPDEATIETEIAVVARDLRDTSTASALALVQLAAVASLLAVEARLRDRRNVAPGFTPEELAARPPAGWRGRVAVAAALTPAVVLLAGPLVALVHRSFRVGAGYGLAWYRGLGGERTATSLFVAPVDAVRTSLLYAAVATVLAVAIGMAAATVVAARSDRLSRGVDTFLALPLGTSAVTVGLGFLVGLDEPPLALRDSWWLVPLAHAVIGVPFVVRAVVPALRAVDPRLREAAAVLGARPWAVWRDVDLAMSWRAVLVAAAFAFAVSLGEFGATSVLARADTPTVTVTIERLLDGRGGAASLGQASAMSVVLLVLTAGAVAVADRGRTADVSAF
jgi:thiamine transport system permease protein